MVAGALAIITMGSKSHLAVYRGKHSEFYGKNGAKYTQSFAGERPPSVLTPAEGRGMDYTLLFF